MRPSLDNVICFPRILNSLCVSLLEHGSVYEGVLLVFALLGQIVSSVWARMGLMLFGLLIQAQAHDSNRECAGWMSEWVIVTGILVGHENSLPKEYFNGFSSAAALTTPLSIPLIFHRLHNNLSPGLKRPITLARLLLAGTAPGSLRASWAIREVPKVNTCYGVSHPFIYCSALTPSGM